MIKQSIYSFSIDELRDYLSAHGFARFAADRIYNQIYKQFQFDMDQWSNVSKKIKHHFSESINLLLPQPIQVQHSQDGTRKFLFEMEDGESVECVAIPGRDRLTLCVSSQVGCAVGCRFCSTGTMGFIRDLSCEEIVGQYLGVTRWYIENNEPEFRISNVVFMGQGEPLLNIEPVKKAIQILMESMGICLGHKKITLSTSGVPGQIEHLIDFPPVNLAISLHAAFDHKRNELMPINRRGGLKVLCKEIDNLQQQVKQSVTYEYLLVDHFNDGLEDIEGLEKLLDKKNSKINIIPFNEFPGSDLKRPPESSIIWFREQLYQRGFVCTVRTSMGDDILAACGQLKNSSTNLS